MKPGAAKEMFVGAYNLALWVTVAVLLCGCASAPVAEKSGGMRSLSAESVKAADAALERR